MRPDWLIIHRVINYRTIRHGDLQYLVKWKELGYEFATWEAEDADIAGLQDEVAAYNVRWWRENDLIVEARNMLSSTWNGQEPRLALTRV